MLLEGRAIIRIWGDEDAVSELYDALSAADSGCYNFSGSNFMSYPDLFTSTKLETLLDIFCPADEDTDPAKAISRARNRLKGSADDINSLDASRSGFYSNVGDKNFKFSCLFVYLDMNGVFPGPEDLIAFCNNRLLNYNQKLSFKIMYVDDANRECGECNYIDAEKNAHVYRSASIVAESIALNDYSSIPFSQEMKYFLPDWLEYYIDYWRDIHAERDEDEG
jgi:hypothetical protein